MSHSRSIENEVNAPYQMRDVILWGCAAIIAATAAITSYVTHSGFELSQIAEVGSFDKDNKAGGPQIAGKTAVPSDDIDNIVTGSISPKNSAATIGTTVVQKQSNADTIRRMRDEQSEQYPIEQPLISSENSNLGSGPIGIDLGTGHSFSVLGRRFSALVNAAPTLFTNLSPRASIVEHETSIEAHLVAGPVKDIDSARKLCKKIQTRINTTCQPTNFTGRKLKLF